MREVTASIKLCMLPCLNGQRVIDHHHKNGIHPTLVQDRSPRTAFRTAATVLWRDTKMTIYSDFRSICVVSAPINPC
jgi:hypothetical protein